MDCNIRIRPYRPSDAVSLYDAARESVHEVYPWLPWCRPDLELIEAEEWIGTRIELFATRDEFNFVIEDADGVYLGGCGLNQINPIHQIANLGYWVRTSATRRGVATAAVRQLAGFAFESTDLLRLEILCALGNHGSQRVAEKAGARLEGVLHDRLLLHGRARDARLYSFVRSEWESRRSREGAGR